MRKCPTIPAGDLYCTICHNKGIPIIRKASKGREAGHLKKLYCCCCNRETNHVECKLGTHYDYSDFLLECQYNNFDEAGNRKIEYGQLRAKLNKEGLL